MKFICRESHGGSTCLAEFDKLKLFQTKKKKQEKTISVPILPPKLKEE